MDLDFAILIKVLLPFSNTPLVLNIYCKHKKHLFNTCVP